MKRVLSAALVVLSASLASLSSDAHAKFSVCNQSIDVINVAIGVERDGVFSSEGWWTIGANQCADVLRTALESRFVYVFAIDVFGQSLLSGTTPLCVGRRRFQIAGTADCWERGYRAERFFEVDTQNVSSWTLFVAAPAQ